MPRKKSKKNKGKMKSALPAQTVPTLEQSVHPVVTPGRSEQPTPMPGPSAPAQGSILESLLLEEKRTLSRPLKNKGKGKVTRPTTTTPLDPVSATTTVKEALSEIYLRTVKTQNLTTTPQPAPHSITTTSTSISKTPYNTQIHVQEQEIISSSLENVLESYGPYTAPETKMLYPPREIQRGVLRKILSNIHRIIENQTGKQVKQTPAVSALSTSLALSALSASPSSALSAPTAPSTSSAPTKKTEKKRKKSQLESNILSRPELKVGFHSNPNMRLLKKWPKSKKVPAFFLHKPINFLAEFHQLTLEQFRIRFPRIGRNYVKIMCDTVDQHEMLVNYANSKNLPYHTYGYREHLRVKLVIRGLPTDIDLEAVKNALIDSKIPIDRIIKIKTNTEQTESVLLVVVAANKNGQKILQVRNILGYPVTLETPQRKPRQCHRCQRWGHSQKYCVGKIKCVKCSGEHWSKDCKREPSDSNRPFQPTCSNCNKSHTANYRQCGYCPESIQYIKSQRIKKKHRSNMRNIAKNLALLHIPLKLDANTATQ